MADIYQMDVTNFEPHSILDDLPPDMRVVDCSCCREMMVVPYSKYDYEIARQHNLPVQGGRIKGRRWCQACLRPARHLSDIVVRCKPMAESRYDPSPWGENAVRAMEDYEGE